MKKLLGILVLGLLWCNVGVAEIITLKCIAIKKEVAGKEENLLGEKYILEEEDIFVDVDTKDKEAIVTELMYVWFWISDRSVRNDSTDKFMGYITINRYDLTRVTKTVIVDEKTANEYEVLWESRKNDPDVLGRIVKDMEHMYINQNYSKTTDGVTILTKHTCEKIEKKL